jgi:hypothetical protein
VDGGPAPAAGMGNEEGRRSLLRTGALLSCMGDATRPWRSLANAETDAAASDYWRSLVTSCCMLLAWARAEMPVWLRISYLDILLVAEA